MKIQLTHILFEGYAAIQLENHSLGLVVVPELGGKIVSLWSQHSGREWLWTNPYLTLGNIPRDAADYGKYDVGGWDEIFPTVASCRVSGSGWGDAALTDHGELWQRSWHLEEAAIDATGAATLTLAVSTPTLPFRFRRTLALTSASGALRISYQVENLGKGVLPYLWAAHPLLAISPGDTIHLPSGTAFRVSTHLGFEPAQGEHTFHWPTLQLASRDSLDLSLVPAPDAGIAAKVFTERIESGTAEVVGRNGTDRLRFTFHTSRSMHYGLWLNYGAWSGAGTLPYFNLGLEPTTSPHDDLNLAREHGEALVLEAGESHSWGLTVLTGGELLLDD